MLAGRADVSLTPGVDCRERKCIALTFDDGPVGHTGRLLDTLAEHGVKATFFVIGRNVAASPGLVRRQVAEGHVVGNHSYTHANLGQASAAAVRAEIGRTQSAVEAAAGVRPELFRPPYGATGPAVTAVARGHRLPQILWSLDTRDWLDRDAGVIERRVIRGARAGQIVLLHDLQATTVQAVPAILRGLTAEGFSFVTVPELFAETPLKPGRRYTGRPPSG